MYLQVGIILHYANRKKYISRVKTIRMSGICTYSAKKSFTWATSHALPSAQGLTCRSTKLDQPKRTPIIELTSMNIRSETSGCVTMLSSRARGLHRNPLFCHHQFRYSVRIYFTSMPDAFLSVIVMG